MIVFSTCSIIGAGIHIFLTYRYLDGAFEMVIYFNGTSSIYFPIHSWSSGTISVKKCNAKYFYCMALYNGTLCPLKEHLQIFSLYFSAFWDFLMEFLWFHSILPLLSIWVYISRMMSHMMYGTYMIYWLSLMWYFQLF